jgi:hypothetical protein
MAENVPIYIQLETGQAEQNIGNIKKAIKELESEALKAGDAQSEAYIKAAQKAGQLKDSLEDIRDATKSFKGDPLEGLSKGLGSLKGRLADLDFQGFNEEIGRLNKLSKQTSFKDLASSVGETGKSFLSLGKILLTNPIFLIASIITTIIANFDKLKEAGGFVGKVFSAIGDAVSFAIQMLKDLSDWLGLTDFKGQEVIKNQEEVAKNALNNIKDFIANINEDVENKRQEFIKNADGDLKKASKAYGIYVEQIIADNNQLIADYERAQKSGKKLTETQTAGYEAALKENEALAKSVGKFQTDIDKENQAINDKAKQQREKRKSDEKALADEISGIREEQYQATLDQFDKEARQIDLKYEKLIKEAKRLGKDTSEIQKLYNAEISALNKKQGEAEAKQEAENQKKIQEEKDKAAAIALQKQKDVDDLTIELMADGIDKEIAQTLAKYDEEYAAAEGNAEKQRLLTDKVERDIADIEKKYADEGKTKRLENLAKTQEAYDALFSGIAGQLQSASENFDTLGFSILGAANNIASGIQKTISVFQSDTATTSDKLVAGFQAAAGAINEISNILAENTQRRLDEIASTRDAQIAAAEETKNAEITAIEQQVEAGVITKEEGDKRKAESEYKLKLAEFNANEKARKAEFDAKKKAFEQEKKARIASALAQGAAAAIAAYTSGAAVPLVGPITTGPAFAAISAAFTAAQVALIASQKFEGSFTAGVAPTPPTGGGGIPGLEGGGGAGGASTFNAPQFFGLGQGVFQNQGNERQQQVVVLENDITNVQNRVRVIENRATIG